MMKIVELTASRWQDVENYSQVCNRTYTRAELMLLEIANPNDISIPIDSTKVIMFSELMDWLVL
jgi:hypothetical protein